MSDIHEPPQELQQLARWGSYKVYDGANGYQRVIPHHPASTRRKFKVKDPNSWVTFDEVAAAGKPYGLLVRADDNLGAILNAPPDVAVRFVKHVVFVVPSVDGKGQTVIVRAGTPGATTGFVPLWGGVDQARTGAAGVDHGRTAAGGVDHGVDHELTKAVRENKRDSHSELTKPVVCSSALLKTIIGEGFQGESVDHQLSEMADRIIRQGKAGCTSWAYALVNVFKAHRLSQDDLPVIPLLDIDRRFGERDGYSHTLAVDSWEGWRANRVGVVEAYRAIRATGRTSLPDKYKDIDVDAAVVVAACVCAWMGQDGEAFPLSGEELANGLGLKNQQEGSRVLLAV